MVGGTLKAKQGSSVWNNAPVYNATGNSGMKITAFNPTAKTITLQHQL